MVSAIPQKYGEGRYTVTSVQIVTTTVTNSAPSEAFSDTSENSPMVTAQPSLGASLSTYDILSSLLVLVPPTKPLKISSAEVTITGPPQKHSLALTIDGYGGTSVIITFPGMSTSSASTTALTDESSQKGSKTSGGISTPTIIVGTNKTSETSTTSDGLTISTIIPTTIVKTDKLPSTPFPTLQSPSTLAATSSIIQYFTLTASSSTIDYLKTTIEYSATPIPTTSPSGSFHTLSHTIGNPTTSMNGNAGIESTTIVPTIPSTSGSVSTITTFPSSEAPSSAPYSPSPTDSINYDHTPPCLAKKHHGGGPCALEGQVPWNNERRHQEPVSHPRPVKKHHGGGRYADVGEGPWVNAIRI